MGPSGNLVKSYSKTNVTAFVLHQWKKLQVGLTFFWPVQGSKSTVANGKFAT